MLLRATDVPEAKTKIYIAKKKAQATTGIQALIGPHYPNIHIYLYLLTLTYGNRYSLLQLM